MKTEATYQLPESVFKTELHNEQNFKSFPNSFNNLRGTFGVFVLGWSLCSHHFCVRVICSEYPPPLLFCFQVIMLSGRK